MHEESRCRDLNDRLKSLAQKHQADSPEANRLRFLVRNLPEIKSDSRNGVVKRVRIIMHEESRCRDLNDRLKSLAQKHQADSTEANRLRLLVRILPKIKSDSRNGVVKRVRIIMHEESRCRDLNDRLKSLAQKHQADSTEANQSRFQNKV